MSGPPEKPYRRRSGARKLDRTQKDRNLFYTQIDKLGKPEKLGTRLGDSIVVTKQRIQKEEAIAEKVVDAAFTVYKVKAL